MQKSLTVVLLMLVVCRAASSPPAAFPQAGTGREFGQGWIRKSFSCRGCRLEKNQGAAEELWAGEQRQFSAGLAPSLGAVLLLTPPSLSTSACQDPT